MAGPSSTITLEVLQGDQDFPEERRCWTDNVSFLCPLIISEAGDLIHQGVPIAAKEIAELRREWSDQGFPVLGVAVHPTTPHAQVVEQLSAIDEAIENSDSAGQVVDLGIRFAFSDWDRRRYDAVGRERNLDAAAEFQEQEFVGGFDPYSLPVLVGYSERHRACVFKINGISLSSGELWDRAFTDLDNRIIGMRGVEPVLEETPEIERLVARIQVNANTPWPCVAAAAYQVSAAGWPFIRYEVLEEPPA